MRNKKLVFPVAVGIAVLAHTPFLLKSCSPKDERRQELPSVPGSGSSAMPFPSEPLEEKPGRETSKRRPSFAIQQERKKLIGDARRDYKKGTLEMGKFILEANKLDSEDRGETADIPKALSAYSNLLAALKKNLGLGPRKAIFETLGHFDYFRVTNTVAEALLRSGGNCDALSHLAIALLYDAGVRNNLFLRVYGPNQTGYGHIAPTIETNGREYDLTAGTKALKTGLKLPPKEIIEAYARAHGLAPMPKIEPPDHGLPGPHDKIRPGPGYGFPFPPGRSSGFAYPSDGSSFPGFVPEFAENAFRKPSEEELEEGRSIYPEVPTSVCPNSPILASINRSIRSYVQSSSASLRSKLPLEPHQSAYVIVTMKSDGDGNLSYGLSRISVSSEGKASNYPGPDLSHLVDGRNIGIQGEPCNFALTVILAPAR